MWPRVAGARVSRGAEVRGYGGRGADDAWLWIAL